MTRCVPLHGSRASWARTSSSDVGVDDEDDPQLAGEWPAEDDEPVVDEAVHECGVLEPAGLLFERPCGIPLRAAAAFDDEIRGQRRILPLMLTNLPQTCWVCAPIG